MPDETYHVNESRDGFYRLRTVSGPLPLAAAVRECNRRNQVSRRSGDGREYEVRRTSDGAIVHDDGTPLDQPEIRVATRDETDGELYCDGCYNTTVPLSHPCTAITQYDTFPTPQQCAGCGQELLAVTVTA